MNTYLTALGIVDAHDGTSLQRDYLIAIARKHRGNRKAMAEDAKVSEATLYRAISAQALEGVQVEIEAQRIATVQELARLTARRTFKVSVNPDMAVLLRVADRSFIGQSFEAALLQAVQWARAEKEGRRRA